jgi:hypothetical protein
MSGWRKIEGHIRGEFLLLIPFFVPFRVLEDLFCVTQTYR